MTQPICANLNVFVDGELEPAEAADAFRAHLPGCVKCQAGLEELLQLGSLAARAAVTTAAPPPPPVEGPGLAEALQPMLIELPTNETMDALDDDGRSGLHRTASVRLTFAQIRIIYRALADEEALAKTRRQAARDAFWELSVQAHGLAATGDAEESRRLSSVAERFRQAFTAELGSAGDRALAEVEALRARETPAERTARERELVGEFPPPIPNTRKAIP